MLLKVLTDGLTHVQVRQRGRDIANKMLHKAQQGGTTGMAKLGYLNARKPIDGHLVNTIDIDPDRAPLIKWAFEAYASGDFTLARLRDELEVKGLTTRATRVRSEQTVSLSALGEILRDPYYTGVVTYKGEIYEGRHPALVSVDLFQRVEVVMAARRKRGTRERVHHHFLKGALFCHRCSTSETRRPLLYLEASGNGGTYEYFVCRTEPGCGLASIPVAQLEAAFDRFLERDLTELAPRLEQYRTELRKMLLASRELEREIAVKLRQQLQKIALREERFLDLAAEDGLPTAKLRDRLRDLTLERRGVEAQLASADNRLEKGVASIEQFLDLLATPFKLYRSLDEPTKRSFLDTLYEYFTLDMDDYERIEVRGHSHAHVDALKASIRATSAEMQEAPVCTDGSFVSNEPEEHRHGFGLRTAVGVDPAAHHADRKLRRKTRTPTQDPLVVGLCNSTLVGRTGLEPVTDGL